MTNRIGKPAADSREDAPDQTQDADEITDRLIVESKSRRSASRHHTRRGHARKQRRDDPAVQADQAEPYAEQCDGFPFIILVPRFVGTRHQSGLLVWNLKEP